MENKLTIEAMKKFSVSMFWIIGSLCYSCRSVDEEAGDQGVAQNQINKLNLRVEVEEYSNSFRIIAYLENLNSVPAVIATCPIERGGELIELRMKGDDRLVLMLSIIPPGTTLENEVFSDSSLGRVVLGNGELVKVFSHDFEKKDNISKVEVFYISFPDSSYRDYWSGEISRSVELRPQSKPR